MATDGPVYLPLKDGSRNTIGRAELLEDGRIMFEIFDTPEGRAVKEAITTPVVQSLTVGPPGSVPGNDL